MLLKNIPKKLTVLVTTTLVFLGLFAIFLALNGKLLQIAFTLREGKVRPISARPAHPKERKQYEEILRKISKGI
jgi:hypothetical protein